MIKKNKLLFFLFLISYPYLNTKAQALVNWQDSLLTFDYGDLDYGRSYEHAFLYKNLSLDTIRIETIRTDCGCTVPDWEDIRIPPGESGQILVSYTPKRECYFKEKVRVFFTEQKKAEILFVKGYVFKE